jgi:hypothetical protein
VFFNHALGILSQFDKNASFFDWNAPVCENINILQIYRRWDIMVRTGDIIFRTAMHELQRLERGGQNRIPFFIFTAGAAHPAG